MRSTAHMRFTAVGRAERTSSATGSISSKKASLSQAQPCPAADLAPSFDAHTASAAAPAMPIAGAPRTASVLIASTITRQSDVVSNRSS